MFVAAHYSVTPTRSVKDSMGPSSTPGAAGAPGTPGASATPAGTPGGGGNLGHRASAFLRDVKRRSLRVRRIKATGSQAAMAGTPTGTPQGEFSNKWEIKLFPHQLPGTFSYFCWYVSPVLLDLETFAQKFFLQSVCQNCFHMANVLAQFPHSFSLRYTVYRQQLNRCRFSLVSGLLTGEGTGLM